MANYAALASSGFHCAAFNSAIFDGPVRIYFAQIHETTALKIYFLLQQSFSSNLQNVRALLPSSTSNLMIMIYPDSESRKNSFPDQALTQLCHFSLWEGNLIFGLCNPLDEDDLRSFVRDLVASLKNKTEFEVGYP